MVYIVMAYVAMAYIVIPNRVRAFIVMPYIGMTYTIIACVVMARPNFGSLRMTASLPYSYGL